MVASCVFIYTSILKVIGIYELKYKYDHERPPYRENSQDKFNRYFHFVLNKLLFFFFSIIIFYFLFIIIFFLILCLNSGTVVVPLNTHIEPIWVPYSNGRTTLEP